MKSNPTALALWERVEKENLLANIKTGEGIWNLIVGFLLGFWILIFGFSSALALDLGGYYENDPVLIIKRDGATVAGDMNRLRFKIDQKLGDTLKLHFEPRYYLFMKSVSLPLVGVSDLDRLVWDKYYGKLDLPLLSITAGKQRIAWGTSYIWNPTDVFNPFVFSFAVKEDEEANVEAVRLEIPVGVAGRIDGYIMTGRDWSQTKKGIRAKGNIGLFDLSASYVSLEDHGFQLGFDSAGEIFGFGIRNEIAMKSPAGQNRYFQSTWGWDYTLENGVGLNMEYFFNGLGKRNKDEYDWNGLEKGEISQLGMDYLFFSANRIVDEITQIRASVIMNLDDFSYILYPQYQRNIAQNVDLSLESMITGGQDGSEYYPTDQQDDSGFAGSKLILARITCYF